MTSSTPRRSTKLSQKAVAAGRGKPLTMSILVGARTPGCWCRASPVAKAASTLGQMLVLRHQRRRRRDPQERAATTALDGAVPVYDTVRPGGRVYRRQHQRHLTCPRASPADAVLEAADAGHRGDGVAITEGIPARDMVRVTNGSWGPAASRMIGPNCPGAHHARRGQGRHHLRATSVDPGPGRPGQPLRHAHLRGRARQLTER